MTAVVIRCGALYKCTSQIDSTNKRQHHWHIYLHKSIHRTLYEE